MIINKKKENLPYSGLCPPSRPQSENEKKEKYLDLARELRKLWNVRETVTSTVIGVLETVFKGLIRWLEELKIQGRIETSIFKISENTEKKLGDLRRRAVIWILMKDHQLVLMWEARKKKNTHNNNNEEKLSLVGWLFCFTAYQPFSDHLSPN